jgi:hypothetical protein
VPEPYQAANTCTLKGVLNIASGNKISKPVYLKSIPRTRSNETGIHYKFLPIIVIRVSARSLFAPELSFACSATVPAHVLGIMKLCISILNTYILFHLI